MISRQSRTVQSEGENGVGKEDDRILDVDAGVYRMSTEEDWFITVALVKNNRIRPTLCAISLVIFHLRGLVRSVIFNLPRRCYHCSF